MSEQNLDQPSSTPTTLDLHTEQARHGVILETLSEDVREIKEVFLGNDNKEGLIIDVDRLKRSRALFHAILWLVFTVTVGTSATLIAAAIMQ